jgi:hypothetical protein
LFLFNGAAQPQNTVLGAQAVAFIEIAKTIQEFIRGENVN